MNLSVMDGEFLGIIGHTGSGKSTLIQHLNGLLKPTSGRILLQGRDIWADPKRIRDVRFQVGLVFQYPEYQLFEETVYKDIAFGPRNMGLDEADIDRRVRSAAAFVGLTEAMLDKSPFELSDGHVFMEGTPRQVFTRADELEQVGLDIPQVTKVALILRQRGLPVDTAVYTVEALRDALLRLKGGDAVC